MLDALLVKVVCDPEEGGLVEVAMEDGPIGPSS